MKNSRPLWSVWKETARAWKVQFPKGIMTFTTKCQADHVAKESIILEAKASAIPI